MLDDELYFQRATQLYLWSLPAVNIMAMKEGSEKAYGAGYNVSISAGPKPGGSHKGVKA
jgi:hypothetical protein